MRVLPLLALLAAPAFAADVNVSVELPRLDVAEYHKPYVAIWIEQPNQSHVANLAVWYDLKMANKEGEKWLKDMRQFWRRTGRSLEFPVDGVSGATKAVGTHTLTFDHNHPAFKTLPKGDYNIVVEAAREVGGRELLRVPFSWPADKAYTAEAQGKTELGLVKMSVTP